MASASRKSAQSRKTFDPCILVSILIIFTRQAWTQWFHLGEVSSGEQRAGIMSSERNLSSGFRDEITQLQLQLELQLQALEIIDEILSGTAPTESEARRSLTWHVAHHPGHPQRALLMHLLTLPRSDHR
jgi:hypothetical protein